MRISVIIPVLNEEKSIGSTIAALNALHPHEIIVVDGGSSDRTRRISVEAGAKVLTTGPGRARQMNRGALDATGDVLLFLHADTRLPASALRDIESALSDPRYLGGRFDVELDSDRWLLKVVGFMISLRSRISKVATGDQALFVRREIFAELDGFPDMPLMEDIAFCRRLKRLGDVACLRTRVTTSARRWEVEGVWRTIFRMWTLKLLYLAGVSPARLKRFYADTR
ncbi:MAG: TIGR04283 family arsenosugar biosynthesis glycosyltransferase [Deltaproteobacteria bacterium]|nr:TIGR04283 family arsenosugar biosynthesis glycosyltransferase [Deltaproteobacteria bacterium]MDZ4345481.1 TIGR04283 family arsenosugar biosynthesis glycosyltransferase [Candidatus Binatia bacterium]